MTVAYRRRLIDSPSYTLNHEEVEKALEEGIAFAEGLTPLAVEVDNYGAVQAVCVSCASVIGGEGKWQEAGEVRLPASAVFVAAGTQPNTVLAREDVQHFAVDGKYFQACDEYGARSSPSIRCPSHRVPTCCCPDILDGRFVVVFRRPASFIFRQRGESHGFDQAGLSGGLRGCWRSTRALSRSSRDDFFAALSRDLLASVHRVERLTPTIVEVVIKASCCGARIQSGPVLPPAEFRDSRSRVVAGKERTQLQMEGLALTGAWVDRNAGLVSTIVLEMGGSSESMRDAQARRAGRR